MKKNEKKKKRKYHLAFLGSFLDLSDKLFLLGLQSLPLPFYFPDGFI
jgi:hypothetical protein